MFVLFLSMGFALACIFLSSHHLVQAAGTSRYASPSGSGTSCTLSSPCLLQTAGNASVAGDTVILQNGTYTLTNYTPTNSGTSGNPITLKALNPRQAILQGTNTCGGITPILNFVNRNYWVVQDLILENTQRAVYLDHAIGIEIKNTIIRNFHADGIAVYSSSTNNNIHDNVIGYGDACNSSYDDAGIYVYRSGNNTITNNIIVATGNNNYTLNNPNGGGLMIVSDPHSPADGAGNLVQGNLFLDNIGKTGTRFVNISGSTYGDNIVMFSQGGATDTSDCSDDSNQFINNFIYGNYHQGGGSKGQLLAGGAGHHTWQHNLFYILDSCDLPCRDPHATLGPA